MISSPRKSSGLRAQTQREVPIRHWGEQALGMVTGIERANLPLDLECQGQFIALTNATEMQLESGAPVAPVVRLLGDALLALARARRPPQPTQTDLAQRVAFLNQTVGATAGAER